MHLKQIKCCDGLNDVSSFVSTVIKIQLAYSGGTVLTGLVTVSFCNAPWITRAGSEVTTATLTSNVTPYSPVQVHRHTASILRSGNLCLSVATCSTYSWILDTEVVRSSETSMIIRLYGITYNVEVLCSQLRPCVTRQYCGCRD